MEIRTKQFNLLMCILRHSENEEVLLELKNGKRTECISLQEFISTVNDFVGNSTYKIKIVTK